MRQIYKMTHLQYLRISGVMHYLHVTQPQTYNKL